MSSTTWISFAYEWQSLLGALFGTMLPVCISLLIYWWQSRVNLRKSLISLLNQLARLITELDVIEQELNGFTERVDTLCDELALPGNSYFLGKTNFPSVELGLSPNLTEIRTRSLYLTNKLLYSYSLLRHINSSIQDLQFEFRQTIQHNHERFIAAKEMEVRPDTQKELFRRELIPISNAVKIGLLKNIDLATSELVRMKVYLDIYIHRPFMTRHAYEGLIYAKLRDNDDKFVVEKQMSDSMSKTIEELKLHKQKIRSVSPIVSTG